jgi:alpha-ketoglutarate-dependent taurine dioxygenase
MTDSTLNSLGWRPHFSAQLTDAETDTLQRLIVVHWTARLKRFHKLLSEDRHNTASIAERRARDKHFGKLVKSVIAGKRREKSNK